jgi:iron complex outermembrane receptor protein
MKLTRWGASTLAIATVAFAQNSWAQQAAAPQAAPSGDAGIETLIVTGTREKGVSAEKSMTPIDIVGVDDLKATAIPNLNEQLQHLDPSFSTSAYGGDTAALTTVAKLRGLSPNQVLVLINGKRVHTSANIFADPGPDQGTNAVDLSLIPSDAIDHIEILKDGAAAQYGSDAIAGVINIILKSADHGGSVSATSGAYYGSPFNEVHDGGDGFHVAGSGNVGAPLGETGFLNLTTEYKHQANSNITGPDLRGAAGGVPSDPYQSRIYGDPSGTIADFTYNTGVNFDGLDLYSFATYAHKTAKAFENYRTETKGNGLTLPDGTPLPNPYPLGFEPAETITEDSYNVTIGAKGTVLGWNWDLSSVYGADNDTIGNVGGVNLDLYAATGKSPHDFRTGNLSNSEWTNNLDLVHPYDIGLAEPLNVAFGAEYRYETYQLTAGDPASRYGAGSQANPGFSLSDQHSVYRDSVGAYVDLETKITSAWSVGAAGRYESFSDFGDTQDGKFSTRYDFIPEFGIRGTVSDGFRAPSLAQEYFSATNVGPGYASAQLPVNSAGAALLGAQALKPEVSNNYSFGLISEPLPHLSVTLDAYQINIHNRIVDTGQFTGTTVLNAIQDNGNVVEKGDLVFAQYFANAVTTHTRGLELSAEYPEDLGDLGEVKWSVKANYNNTVALVPLSSAIRFNLDASAISYITTAAPHDKIIGDAFWTNDPWDVNLRGTYYGQSSTVDLNTETGSYYANKVDPAFIVDLEIGYTLNNWHFTVGADNLFNTFPNKVNPIGEAPVNAQIYNTFSPYGYQGGYYYTRVTYSFGEEAAPSPIVPAVVPVEQPKPVPEVKTPEKQRSFQVFFDFDKSDVTEAAAQVIAAAAESVKAGNVTTITVTGHTDTVGTARYNQALSERRAAAVKKALVADGVAGGEITTIGVGKTGLLVPTADGVREPQNRRAEIVLQ